MLHFNKIQKEQLKTLETYKKKFSTQTHIIIPKCTSKLIY